MIISIWIGIIFSALMIPINILTVIYGSNYRISGLIRLAVSILCLITFWNCLNIWQ